MFITPLLSPAAGRRLKNERKEIARCFAASDIELAQALLAYSRRCRQLRAAYHDHARPHYGSALAWLDIPDMAWLLARHAGHSLLLAPGEGHRPLRASYLAGDKAAFRLRIGVMLQNTGHLARVPGLADDEPDPWDVVTHEACNGNPIAFAADRLAPPPADAADPLASHIRSIAERRGHGPQVTWTPLLNQSPAALARSA